jgi:hypothetical protein
MIDELEKLEEARFVVRRLVIGFPEESGNFTDAHSSLPPFGNQWGRGVLFRKDGEYIARVGSGGSSHAQLKQGSGGAEVVKTFYFGFADDTLFIDHASVSPNLDFDRPMLVEIAASISESGPLRGAAYRLGK